MSAAPPPGGPPGRRTSIPLIFLGILASIALTVVFTGLGAQFVQGATATVVYLISVLLLVIGGLVKAFRSPRWASFAIGLLMGWALHVIALGACIAMISQLEFG